MRALALRAIPLAEQPDTHVLTMRAKGTVATDARGTIHFTKRNRGPQQLRILLRTWATGVLQPLAHTLIGGCIDFAARIPLAQNLHR